jgi:aminoglycoside phosphotransferase (APT) family kinase protein
MPSPEVPPGIDPVRVGRFFERALPGFGAPLRFELISGGRSNLTYRVDGPGGTCVLRRPPLGHVLPTAHDMVREHRVLAALADTDVPVARPLALCADPEVNGAPFYLMEYRPGVVVNERMPEGFAPERADRRRMGLALAEVLARLHRVDFAARGLADFGRPEGYLERQVRRWAQQWEKSKVGDVAEIDVLIARLRAALPASPPPALVHGDYRLGNVALDPADPGRIVAVFDWEMATLGDPLADVGYTLVYWGEPDDPPEERLPGAFQSVTAQPGFLTRAELAEAYAERAGVDVAHVDFYGVLALYKLAVISEGIYARHLQGKTVGAGFENMQRSSVALARRALAMAERSSSAALRGV